MTKNTDAAGAGQAGKKAERSCLMAYTLNNQQPVICTILSDQPYFYMDADGAAEDEDFSGMEGYAELERDLADLKNKMEAYERMAKTFQADPSRRMEEFLADSINITEPNPFPVSGEKLGETIKEVLGASRMAKSLLEFAEKNDVEIIASRQVSGGRYDRDGNRVLIHPNLALTEQTLVCVRELRRHWQHRHGAGLHPLTFHPDQAILINRAQNADLAIAVIRCAWEMQLSGRKDIWSFIETSDLADLAAPFAREAFMDFRSLYNGKASSSVFESWFLSERCRYHDRKLIQAMLADHQGYVFQSEETSRYVSADLLAALGEQPFGKNYLSPYAQMILSDPVFTEVRDRSNANFLWFIKFERSFRETEQALQSEEALRENTLSGTPPQTQSGFTSQETEHEHESIVIPLPGRARGKHSLPHTGALEERDERANVIHVRFGGEQSA